MSHNITLSGVKINDLALLRNVVNDMGGGKAVLDTDAKNFRTWRGQSTHCDAAIKMPGAHDIGLRRSNDGSYEVVYDPYAMDSLFATTGTTNVIGGLLQEYALREAEIKAAQNGMTTSRQYRDGGMITLAIE
jgi:hypothetical protein